MIVSALDKHVAAKLESFDIIGNRQQTRANRNTTTTGSGKIIQSTHDFVIRLSGAITAQENCSHFHNGFSRQRDATFDKSTEMLDLTLKITDLVIESDDGRLTPHARKLKRAGSHQTAAAAS
jgi:hypothetical protein